MSEHDKLAEAIKERDEARAELQLLKQERDLWQQIQRDEARAEVKRLQAELDEEMEESAQRTHDLAKSRNEWRARCEIAEATVKQLLTVRPEPSRLEIAAMVAPAICHLGCGMDPEVNDFLAACVQVADALIAAAKEVK